MIQGKKNFSVIGNKYNKGEVVFEKIHPSKKLIISRYTDGIYYCEVQEASNRKELVFFEWELMADSPTPHQKSPSMKVWLKRINS